MPVKINLKINKKKASISPYRKKKKKNDKWVSRKKKISQQNSNFSNQGNAPFLYTKKKKLGPTFKKLLFSKTTKMPIIKINMNINKKQSLISLTKKESKKGK